jgi:hypothetical protein
MLARDRIGPQTSNPYMAVQPLRHKNRSICLKPHFRQTRKLTG